MYPTKLLIGGSSLFVAGLVMFIMAISVSYWGVALLGGAMSSIAAMTLWHRFKRQR